MEERDVLVTVSVITGMRAAVGFCWQQSPLEIFNNRSWCAETATELEGKEVSSIGSLCSSFLVVLRQQVTTTLSVMRCYFTVS